MLSINHRRQLTLPRYHAHTRWALQQQLVAATLC